MVLALYIGREKRARKAREMDVIIGSLLWKAKKISCRHRSKGTGTKTQEQMRRNKCAGTNAQEQMHRSKKHRR